MKNYLSVWEACASHPQFIQCNMCVGASGGCVGGPACACEYGSVSVGQHAQYDGASVFDYCISAL